MTVKIFKERSDLTSLVSAAIKTSFNTRSPGGVERCVDVLNQLKSLSLSVKDIMLSESIYTLQVLKKHRHLKIRKEAQALFDSWHKTLNAHTRENSFKVGLTKVRLKLKNSLLTRSSELKKKDDQISLIDEAIVLEKTTGLYMELKNKEEQRSLICETRKIKKEAKSELEKKEKRTFLTQEAEKIKKRTKIDLLKSMKKEDHRSLAREGIKEETKTDLKPLNLKRRRCDASELVKTKKTCKALKAAGKQKMSRVTAITTLSHRSRQNSED